MIVHTGDHAVEIDYNLESQKKTFGDWTKIAVFHMKDMFIVNLWPTRPMEQMRHKEIYFKHQKTEEVENKPCTWKKKMVVEDI